MSTLGNDWLRFETVLRGEVPDRVPLTHTWGLHAPHVRQLLGRPPQTPEDEIHYRVCAGLPLGLRVGRGSPFGGGHALTADGQERYVQGHLKPGCSLRPYQDPGDLSPLLPEWRRRIHASHVAGLAAEACVTSCIHALSIALGLEALAFAAYDQPDWLNEAMDLVERRNRATIAALLDLGVDIVLFDGDCAFKQGLMLSPDMMRRFWLQRTRDTVRLCHDAQTWAYYHTDGRVDQLMPMLVDLGFAAFHGCEKAANNLAQLKRTWGRRITLIGNADQAELTRLSPERIAKETLDMIRTAAPGGRFVADLNTSVAEFIPLENYLAFTDTVRRAGRYAPDGSLVT